MSDNDQTSSSGTRRGLVGRVFGDRYQVTRVASAGASTVIADADDLQLDRRVTMKFVRPEWAESSEFRRRFARTMEVVSTLSHPNLVAVFDWGEEHIGRRATTYAVVERLEGGSLRDLFDRGRLLDPSQALVIGLEACRGLDFAHRKRLVHSELTPSKLVFGDDRRLRIVDFGLARLLGAQDWRDPSNLSTHIADYASPEQALAQPIDAKSDVYSLAVILVEAVTGSVPFAGRSTVATLSARVGRLLPVSADLGPLAAVLERAGRPEPAERSSAAELGRGLVQVASKLPRPGPIPIVVSKLFDDDPNKLRRPNDPTGGVQRPEDVAVDDEIGADGSAIEQPVVGEPVTDDGAGEDGPIEGASTVVEAPDGSSPAGQPAGPPFASPATQEFAPPVAPPPPPPPPQQRGEPDQGSSAIAMASAGTSVALLEHGDAAPSDEEEATLHTSAPTLDDGDPAAATDERAALAHPAAHPITSHADPPAQIVQADVVDRPARRRRRVWPWLLALFVMCALAALVFLASRLFRTPTHPVPELIGRTEADVTQLTEAFDWEIDIERVRSDDEPDVGQIIRSAPVAGVQLAEGEPFLIVVSAGPELRQLPDLEGRQLSVAETELAELRLVALPATEAFDEEAPAGQVVSWSVPEDGSLVAGDEVLPETEIAIVVSSGPAPRVIPELVGLAVGDAATQLEAQQLVVTLGEPTYSDTVPVGGVVAVEPAAGSTAERDSMVVITPSLGLDLVTMPDLTGQTLPQIQASLLGAGLDIGKLLGSTQGVYVSASVNDEDVDPGDQFERGTPIDMILL